MRLDEAGVGLELVEQGGAVAQSFDDAKVVGDLREARVEVEVGGGEFGEERKAYAGGCASEERGEERMTRERSLPVVRRTA